MARDGFGWAIVGPGRIAHRFAEAVTRMDGTRLAAVVGRDGTRAGAFAARWSERGAPAIHTSLDAALRDPAVDGVYVATPHGFHADAVRPALLAGKPVLCEKALAPNARIAAELLSLSRERGVFLMEALWTRFLPAWVQVGDWLAGGAIGDLRGVQSSFFFDPPFDPHSRLFDPAQAGGAMLDIGIYNLSMTQWALARTFGDCPALDALHVDGALAPTGVELRVAGSLVFTGGVVSQFHCGFDGRADNTLRLHGARGHILVESRFWEATRATLQVGDAPPQVVERAFEINGFQGQIAEAMACVARGAIESDVVPHAHTLEVARWIDAIRARLGVLDPFD